MWNRNSWYDFVGWWLCVLQVPQDARSQMFASFDGKDRQALNAGDAVIVRMSQVGGRLLLSQTASEHYAPDCCRTEQRRRREVEFRVWLTIGFARTSYWAGG